MWKRLLLVAAIAVVNFVAWVIVFASLFSRAMGSGGTPSGLESLLLSVLGFPLVPRFGEDVHVVAVNSLTWGLVLGFAIPLAWRAFRRRNVAA